MAGHFTRGTFDFLRDLIDNNNRPWFQENKDRYEKYVKEAALAFITDFGPHLRKVSKYFVADPSPVGGSLFRIYRDTRFSKDKTPYKTAIGIRFTHELGKDVHAPGYYLHIAKDGCFAACGIWRPDGASLGRIRDAIVDDGTAWKRARDAKSLTSWDWGGDTLKRAPRGYDQDHPLIDDLRRKDFIVSRPLTRKDVTSAELPERLAALYREGTPLQRFICRALSVPF
ncbi:MAG: DUF2461 domain-containing protein [Gemmatimonadota bacterium]|nr:DUF2461 domain-containing protein [Gemmatimonadota bacterium]